MREKLFAGLACLTLSIMLAGCPLFEGPEAAFTATPTEGNVPLTVLFVDQSQPGSTDITDWLWDFGDGLSSTAQNPSHVYSSPGTYRVTLTVTSRLGNDTETKIDYITVRQLPKADFTASPKTGEGPLQVTFTDTSTAGAAPITNYEWDFGDENTSEDANPVHTYEDPGVYTVSLKVTTSIGDSTATKANFITVQQRPVAAFSASPTAGASPLTVQFTDESDRGSAPITDWFWTFGDGTSSNRQNPTHVYTAAGTYAVSLTVTTEVGVSPATTMMDFIEVEELPTAQFSASPTTGSAPLNVNFTDMSSDGSDTITEWLWDFGDSTSSTLPSPSHRYASDGVYDVSLTITTSNGNTDTITKTNFITAQQLPEAAFSATPRNGESPLTVQFSDLSDPGSAPRIDSWQWDFGDGSTSSESEPFHAYTSPGRYTVTLGVSTAVGSDKATQVNYIEVEALPTAAFSATPTTGAAPLTVLFADQSDPGSSEITDWAWDFGDGTSSTQQNPSKTYSQAGIYTVELTVTSAGRSDTITRANHITVRQLPVADFSTNVTTGKTPLTVLFSDQSSPGSENLTGWQWDFGDGTTPSTLQNPSHVYSAPGIFTISLTATSSVGSDTETKSNYLTVRPNVNFTANTTNGNGSLSVQFTDTTVLGDNVEVTSRSWDFGDDATSTEATPVHIYNEPGVYDVTLTLQTDLDGQSDSRTREGYIKVRPVPEFSADVQTGDGTLLVNFSNDTNLAALDLIGVMWDFGDGETSQTENPTHTYTLPGIYTVELTVITAAGNPTTTETDFVEVRPVPAISATPTTGEVGQVIDFRDNTVLGNLTFSGRLWDFGDGNTSEQKDPNHSYTEPGNYDVTLTVSTSEGSESVTTTEEDFIQISPTIDFSATTPTSGMAPLTVMFTPVIDTGSLTIESLTWNFGDGTAPSNETEPDHEYTTTTDSPFDVSLTVTTTEQGAKTVTKEDFIAVSAKSAPTALDSAPGTATPALMFLDVAVPEALAVNTENWNSATGRGFALAKTEDGEQFVAGSADSGDGDGLDAVVVAVDETGTPYAGWPKFYGGAGDQEAFDIAASEDGFIVAGRSGDDAYVLRLDAGGEIVWVQTLGGPGVDRANAVAVLDDCNIAIAGQSDSPGTHGGTDAYVAILDAQGSLLAQDWFGGAGDEAAHDLVLTGAGELVVVGDTATFGADPVDTYLLKLDQDLNELASVTVGGSGTDIARAAIETAGGTIVVAGATTSLGSGGFDAYVFEVDGGLDDVLWERAYGAAGDDRAHDIAAIAGGYVVVGSSETKSPTGVDVLVIVTDEAGNAVRNHAVGDAASERGIAVVETRQGGIGVAGIRSSAQPAGPGGNP